MNKALRFFCLMLLFCKAANTFAQVPPTAQDTMRVINIIKARAYHQKTIDSVTKLDIIAGDVHVQEGSTKFTCDSAIINQRLNILEAFGNVHINQGDSLFTSSQYIKYLGNEKTAYLKKNVKLTDKKGTLLTQELEYNIATGIETYKTGGKVINGKTVLTSKEATYYEDTKDVIFKNNVDVTDPNGKIKADSLLYNMQTQSLTFTGPTHIKNKSGNIFTTQGTYDLKTGSAFFGNRSLVKDSSGRTFQANNMAIDQKSGIVQLEGNGIIKDSANSSIITGNEIFIDQKKSSLLATKKPVLIIWQKKDTTYISADTLFSGNTKRESITTAAESDSVKTDSLKNDLLKKDSLKITPLRKIKIINTDKADTTIRYFLAYHHVRIFNDSLQSVSDSLFYSSADSTFRLFKDPVLWSGKSQVTGDTIYLFTKNKKAERVYVFQNGIIANKIRNNYYNQISGKTINAYFKNGEIDYMRAKGSPAESVYYVQDKDSSFSGMNRANGSVIDMIFKKQELDKVKFLNDVHGKLYPMHQIPADQKYLKNFNWLDKRRPKNKLELFE